MYLYFPQFWQWNAWLSTWKSEEQDTGLLLVRTIEACGGRFDSTLARPHRDLLSSICAQLLQQKLDAKVHFLLQQSTNNPVAIRITIPFRILSEHGQGDNRGEDARACSVRAPEHFFGGTRPRPAPNQADISSRSKELLLRCLLLRGCSQQPYRQGPLPACGLRINLKVFGLSLLNE